MEEMTDWCIVSSTESLNSLENENGGSAESEKVVEGGATRVEAWLRNLAEEKNENSSTKNSSSIPVIEEKEIKFARLHKHLPGAVNALELSQALNNLATSQMLPRGVSSWSLPMPRKTSKTPQFAKAYVSYPRPEKKQRPLKILKQAVDASTNTEHQGSFFPYSSYPRPEKKQRQLKILKQAVDASTNTEHQDDTFNTNSISTAHQINENTNELHTPQAVEEIAINRESRFSDNLLMASPFYWLYFIKGGYVEHLINICLVLTIFVASIGITHEIGDHMFFLLLFCFPTSEVLSNFMKDFSDSGVKNFEDKEDIPGNLEIQDMKESITTLKSRNDLLKQQILDDQEKANRRLETLTGHIFKLLEERENASRYCQQQMELESFYQEEIHLVKEQVSILEADYKTLQNHFKEVNSTIEETRKQELFNESNIGNQVKHSDVSLVNFHDIILLYSQKLNWVAIEGKPNEDCFKSTFLSNPFCIETMISNFSENLNIVKNFILEKCVTFQFDEFIDALKDRISMMLSDFSQFLNVAKKYILEKDIRSRFVEYVDVLRDEISTSYEWLQKSTICLEQEKIKATRKRKINQIRNKIDTLLEELKELHSDINTSD